MTARYPVVLVNGHLRELPATDTLKLDGFSSSRGAILYRGASAWAALAPGTSGQLLQTLGSGADPVWASQPFGFAFERDASNIVVSKAVRYMVSPVAWTMPSGLTDSQGKIKDSTAATAAGPSAQTDFDIQVNGVSKGTMRFAASGVSATFIMSTATAVAVGDVVSLVAPASLNSMAGTLCGPILGVR